MSHDESDPPSNGSDVPVGDRLESWKEIASHLGRGVTTVQRWELEEGLPVHRLPHAKKVSVFAFKSELDAWRVSRVEAGGARPIFQEAAGFEKPSTPKTQLGWLPRPILLVMIGF